MTDVRIRERAVAARRPPAPRTVKGQETRRRLIQAAIQVIGENGLLGARVNEIVRRAGYGYGTFYKYFASKSDLVRQVMAEVYADLHREAFRPDTGAVSPEELIRSGVEGYIDGVARYAPILRAFGRAVEVDPELLELRDRLLHRDVEAMANSIVRWQQAGYRPLGDPYLVSLALNCMADEMSRRWLAYEARVSKEAYVATLQAVFEAVLLGKPESRR